eukprot:SAG31_NODE_8497_length_1441_cov_0.698957_1_plen_422_part_00
MKGQSTRSQLACDFVLSIRFAMQPVLRIPVSKIPAIAGYNEHADLPELLMELLYQDNHELLANDAEILGIEVVSRQQEQWELMLKTGEGSAKLLMGMAAAANAGAPSASAAAEITQSVKSLLQQAVDTGKLSAAEAAVLRDSLCGDVNTSFGTRHENDALDEYEKITGWQVTDRNDRYLRWDVPIDGPVQLPAVGKSARASSRHQRKRHCTIDERVGQEQVQHMADSCQNCGADATSSTGSLSPPVKPVFRIVGSVDGISEQLDASADDPDEWTVVPKIIEVKHRMKQCSLAKPPPLHDQLQLAIYMLMLGTSAGELVQCYRDHNTADGSSPVSSHSAAAAMHISIVDVELQGSKLNHREHIVSSVLPRLQLWTKMVLALRFDDLERWRWLQSPLREQWEIICNGRYCPHLRNCGLRKRPM